MAHEGREWERETEEAESGGVRNQRNRLGVVRNEGDVRERRPPESEDRAPGGMPRGLFSYGGVSSFTLEVPQRAGVFPPRSTICTFTSSPLLCGRHVDG
eukprot:scaffold301866_cov26-Tisochrysis_lutea.AAC.1